MQKKPKLEKSKSERNLFIGFIILLVLIFSPIPYFNPLMLCIPCIESPCPPCSQKWRLVWSPSLFQRTWNFLYPVKPVNVDTGPIEFYPEPEAEIPEPSPVPVPTYEPFEQWNTYTNGEFNYAIKYPKSADLDYKNSYSIPGQKTGIYLLGNEFLVGGSVAIRILENPNNLQHNQIGNETYGIGCSEGIQDLAWKETQFLNQTVLINSNPPPLCGDSSLRNIYLLNHQGKIFAIEISYMDTVDNTYFQDLTNKILSTFRFLD